MEFSTNFRTLLSDDLQPRPSWEPDRSADLSCDDQERLEAAEKAISETERDLDLHFGPSLSESADASSSDDDVD